eukprot:ANDGO_01969.mRNA.1 hypothetical protein
MANRSNYEQVPTREPEEDRQPLLRFDDQEPAEATVDSRRTPVQPQGPPNPSTYSSSVSVSPPVNTSSPSVSAAAPPYAPAQQQQLSGANAAAYGQPAQNPQRPQGTYYAPAYLYQPNGQPYAGHAVPLYQLPTSAVRTNPYEGLIGQQQQQQQQQQQLYGGSGQPLIGGMPVLGPMLQPIQGLGNDFLSGVFDCMDDSESCMLGLCCWSLLGVQNYSRLQGRRELEGKDWLLCLGVTAIYSFVGIPIANMGLAYANRRQMRTSFDFPKEATGIEDAVMAACLGPCIECQMAREYKYRMGLLPLPIHAAPLAAPARPMV